MNDFPLEGIEITDHNFFINLANNCKNLISLWLNCELGISDIGVMSLNNLEKLEYLDIHRNPKNESFTDNSIKKFKNMRRFGCFGNRNISDSSIIPIIQNSPNLYSVEVDYTSVTIEIIREAVALINTRKNDIVSTIYALPIYSNVYDEQLFKRPEYQSP